MTITTNRRGFLKSSCRRRVGCGQPWSRRPPSLRAQQVTRWRCQSMWSAAELTYKAFQDFCERLKVNTNGRLVIEPFAAGAVTGVFETLDAVSAGVLQAHSSWPGYFTRQGCGPGRHQRFRVRLSASASGRGVVPASRRHADAARGLRQVQRLSGRRELVGRGIHRFQEADPVRWMTSRASSSAHRKA